MNKSHKMKFKMRMKWSFENMNKMRGKMQIKCG